VFLLDVRYSASEEDAAINAGIAQDPDQAGLDEEFLKRARSAHEVVLLCLV